MQFRLTKNFAKDCGIKNLLSPSEKQNSLDDWFVDYLYGPRKKIAMLVHAKTLLTFFIAYEDAGSAKKIPEMFHQELKKFFKCHFLFHLVDEVDNLFSEGMTFVKTVDRKILGHMNDFVRCSQPLANEKHKFDCKMEAENINNMPMMVTSRDATFPIDKFNVLLNVQLPRRRS